MSITFKLEKDGKKWHAYCPELHGCHTFGSTKEEALKNIKDVVRLYMEDEGEKAIIRSAEIQDFNAIFLLLGQLWPDKKLNKASLKKVYTRLLNSNHAESLCAEIEGQIVGFCTVAIRDSLWQESSMGHICELIVDEKFRGKKIGTNLIKKASNIAKKRGCKKIELDSAFHREKAHSFYKKIGFEERALLFSKNL